MLTRRRQRVLMALVDEYVESAAPVGSSRIAQQYLREVSPATIRNELMGLVADGYALSPHTSAGRIPTNSGYQVFVNTLLLRGDLKTEREAGIFNLESVGGDLSNLDYDQRIAHILTSVSEITGLLSVFWTIKPDSVVHHRGLPQLLAQPEFHEASALIPLMQLIEDEGALASLFLNTLRGSGFIVKIGIETSGGCLASYSVVAEAIGAQQPQGVIAVFGPTRMDYRKAIPTVLIAARLLDATRSRVSGL